jgi:hypothetical protein
LWNLGSASGAKEGLATQDLRPLAPQVLPKVREYNRPERPSIQRRRCVAP